MSRCSCVARQDAGELGQAGSPSLVFFMQIVAVMSYFEEDDPKSPKPVHAEKKKEGRAERGEARKDNDRDGHRHVHVRC